MEDAAADLRFDCPGCDEAVDVPAEAAGRLVRCPYCNTQFFAAAGRTHDLVVDDLPPPVEFEPDPADLDAVRVRQLSANRIGLLRTRSWCVIAALLATVAAVDLWAALAVHLWRDPAAGLLTGLTAASAVATSAVAGVAARAARRLGREAARSTLADPAEPPDFTGLTAAADPWHRLDQLR